MEQGPSFRITTPEGAAFIYTDRKRGGMRAILGYPTQSWKQPRAHAVLEQLPPDSSVAECLALMSISFNDQWRAQAIARMGRDPQVFWSIYPDWPAIACQGARGPLRPSAGTQRYQREEAARRLAEGESARSVARLLGVSHVTVAKLRVA